MELGGCSDLQAKEKVVSQNCRPVSWSSLPMLDAKKDLIKRFVGCEKGVLCSSAIGRGSLRTIVPKI